MTEFEKWHAEFSGLLNDALVQALLEGRHHGDMDRLAQSVAARRELDAHVRKLADWQPRKAP